MQFLPRLVLPFLASKAGIQPRAHTAPIVEAAKASDAVTEPNSYRVTLRFVRSIGAAAFTVAQHNPYV